MDDRAVVERQLGRPPRALRRVAVRCPYGRPAVTEQAPFDERGEPFPTTYYVTCRHLAAAIARVEAAGGVERWTRAARDDAGARGEPGARERGAAAGCGGELAAGVEGPGLDLGVGGAGRSGSLKCLHAHAAFALARPATSSASGSSPR